MWATGITSKLVRRVEREFELAGVAAVDDPLTGASSVAHGGLATGRLGNATAWVTILDAERIRKQDGASW